MKLLNKKTELSAKRLSYLLYSQRSFSVDLKSYIILFITFICMIVMSCNIIIYNASLSKGENDTVTVKYGEFHTLLENVDNVKNDKINNFSYIKRSYDVCIIGSFSNSNTDSSFKTAKLGIHKNDMEGLYISVTSGTYPRLDEIMISEKISRAFSLQIGDTVNINVNYAGKAGQFPFVISGIFDGCEATDEYMFVSEQTGDAILNYSEFYQVCSYDKFILFDTDFKPYINKYTDELTSFLGTVPLTDSQGYSLRENYMNTEYVNLEEFYQKSGFTVTLLLSILPAAICILIFSFLDVSKSMRELSTLSMIGTTSKQFFFILISKYSVVYLVSFPVGILISSIITFVLTQFAKGLNTADEIFISYTLSPYAILILFILCYAVLCGVTFIVAKNTTSTSYTESLSVMSDMNNVFVRRTSLGLLKEKRRKFKLGLTFLVRNRRVNLMFCSVVGVIFAVFFYFSLLISQSMGNTVLPIERIDYSFVPDTLVSEELKTVPVTAINRLNNVAGVSKVVCTYEDKENADIFIQGDKHMSKPATSAVKTLEKLYMTDALLISEEYEQAQLLYGSYVRSGSLEDVYNNGTIALFVHAYGKSGEYYQAGDSVRISTVSSGGKFTDYTVGAVIYMEHDEYENRDVVRILSDYGTFTELSGKTEPISVGVISDSTNASIESELLNICKDEKLYMVDEHSAFENQKEKMNASVLFYSLLWITVCLILIAIPFSLTKFLLSSSKNTLKTFNMVGTSDKELFKIFGVEFFFTGLISSAFGLILSVIVFFIYKNLSALTYTEFYSNTYTTLFLIISVVIGIVLTVSVPCVSALHYFKKGQYKDAQ